MFIRDDEIEKAAFKSANKSTPIFYYDDENFYYSKMSSFEKFFEEMIFKLEIIIPMRLQMKGYDYNNYKIEREKIEVMERAKKMGITDLNKKYDLKEIIKGDSIFCATGITAGDLVKGINVKDSKYITETLVTHKSSNTCKIVTREDTIKT